MRHFEKTQVSTQGPSQAVNLAGAEVARPQPIKVRQGTADSLGAVQDPSQSDKAASSAGSTLGGETMLHTSGSGGEPWPFKMATMQSQNKMYMATSNLTDIGFAGLQYLGVQLDRLRQEILAVGESSDQYNELMMQLVKKKIKFDKMRMGIYEGNKLPDPFISDIRKICAAGDDDSPAYPVEEALKNGHWMNEHDMADWARLSVMTPTKHLVSRLPESKIGGMVPARLRPTNTIKAGTKAYSPLIFQFFSVSAEVLFIVMTWVFGSVPVLIKSLENPNKKLEVLFYSLFFISWSIVTSMLTPKFETRLYLNVGMAALYVQNIRAG